jgi:hypothetical protein
LGPHAAIRLNSDELSVCGCTPAAIERSGGIAEVPLEPEHPERRVSATAIVRALNKESLAIDALDMLMVV